MGIQIRQAFCYWNGHTGNKADFRRKCCVHKEVYLVVKSHFCLSLAAIYLNGKSVAFFIRQV